MTQSVRIDRNAFRRGVEDVMTFAPLRDAVKTASGVFLHRSGKSDKNTGKDAPIVCKDHTGNDGKSSRK